MEKKDKYSYILGMLDFILVVCTLAFFILGIYVVTAYSQDVPEMQDIINACSDKNLLDSSQCVTSETSDFYRYNLDNIGKDLTFDELVVQGGVCSSWSDYYNQLGKDLGYHSENLIIKLSDNALHEFVVWSNETEYCVIDQIEFYCFNLSS